MSSSEEETHSKHRSDRRRDSPPRKDDRRDKRQKSRSNDEEERSPDRRDKRSSKDHRDRRDKHRRSRSPRDRRRNDRRGDKPIIPQRPKLFQRPETDASTSKKVEDPNSWSTRIAAVASDDGQRSKFEKLLGMHKSKDKAAPALKTVTDEEKKAMQKELSKMTNDLDSQFEQSRAFTHSFRGRGL